jgi:ATP-dependent DNA helicase RecG
LQDIAGYCRILQDKEIMMEISELIKQPESKVLEFKRDLSSLGPILKTIVAFANTAGGIIIIGLANDGNVIGITDVFKAEEAITNAIADSITPTILPEIEIATVEDKSLLLIKVSHWRAPFYVKKEGIPNGVYIRLGSTSRPAGPDLIAELQRSVTNVSYDQQGISNLTSSALDYDKIKRMFRLIGKEITDKKLLSLGALVSLNNKMVPSIGGLILFGNRDIRDQYVPDARVKCARFRGNDKSHLIDQYEVEGTILDAVDEVPKFVARNTRLLAQIQKIRRKDIPEYPEIALREILINALAHADYSIPGSTIQIAIFDDRLEVQNPGMLPFGFTMDDLKAGVSRVRNRVIAKVFHELKLMEEWGSGYKRVIEECRNNGYPEPEWTELGTFIKVAFTPHTKTSQKTISVQSSEELSEREIKILNFFKKGQSRPFREIYEKLSIKISERMLRYVLAQLKKKGRLISTGKGPATVWQKLK